MLHRALALPAALSQGAFVFVFPGYEKRQEEKKNPYFCRFPSVFHLFSYYTPNGGVCQAPM